MSEIGLDLYGVSGEPVEEVPDLFLGGSADSETSSLTSSSTAAGWNVGEFRNSPAGGYRWREALPYTDVVDTLSCCPKEGTGRHTTRNAAGSKQWRHL
jgi:hypothetical protein